MAEQKLYAVRLKDGTWWHFGGDLYVTTDPLDFVHQLLADHVKAGSTRMEGAVAIPVRLVEDTDE